MHDWLAAALVTSGVSESGVGLLDPDIKPRLLERLSHETVQSRWVIQLENALHGHFHFIAPLMTIGRETELMANQMWLYLVVRDAALAHRIRDFERTGDDPNPPETVSEPADINVVLQVIQELSSSSDPEATAEDLIRRYEPRPAVLEPVEEEDHPDPEAPAREATEELRRRLDRILTPVPVPQEDLNCLICQQAYE